MVQAILLLLIISFGIYGIASLLSLFLGAILNPVLRISTEKIADVIRESLIGAIFIWFFWLLISSIIIVSFDITLPRSEVGGFLVWSYVGCVVLALIFWISLLTGSDNEQNNDRYQIHNAVQSLPRRERVVEGREASRLHRDETKDVDSGKFVNDCAGASLEDILNAAGLRYAIYNDTDWVVFNKNEKQIAVLYREEDVRALALRVLMNKMENGK